MLARLQQHRHAVAEDFEGALEDFAGLGRIAAAAGQFQRAQGLGVGVLAVAGVQRFPRLRPENARGHLRLGGRLRLERRLLVGPPADALGGRGGAHALGRDLQVLAEILVGLLAVAVDLGMQHAQVVERRRVVLGHFQRLHEKGFGLGQVVFQQRDAAESRRRRRVLGLPLLRLEIHPSRQVPAAVARGPVADAQQGLHVLRVQIRRPAQQLDAVLHVVRFQRQATQIEDRRERGGIEPGRPLEMDDGLRRPAQFPVRQPEPVLGFGRERRFRRALQGGFQPRFARGHVALLQQRQPRFELLLRRGRSAARRQQRQPQRRANRRTPNPEP